MIYEVRTYTLKPGSVAQFEENFGKALPARQKYSKLGAFWHSEIGPLNQVIHVWPYESVEERNDVRADAAKDPEWPPANPSDMYVSQESEIWHPDPFMRPLGEDQALGNIYEMRTYTYQTGTMGKVLDLLAAAIQHREEHSPLALGMTSELGGLNKWMHVWPYKSLGERDIIRAEASKSPHWPPPTREFLVSQQNKMLAPAAFSPLH